MNRQGWGPQATGGIAAPEVTGRYWYLIAAVAIPVKWGPFDFGNWDGLPIQSGIVMAILLLLLGFRDVKRHNPFVHGHHVSLLVVALFSLYPLIAYTAAYLLGLSVADSSSKNLTLTNLKRGFKSERMEVETAHSPSEKVLEIAARGFGKPGGAHCGWDNDGRYVGAEARGATLIIAPPGAGKSTAILVPSILVAPWTLVAVSTKTDLMDPTWKARAAVGDVYWLNIGGGGTAPEGVIVARWSPLVGITNWDEARTAANAVAHPLISGSGKDDNHFAERGRDWLEVLFYAAVVDGRSIAEVADWAQNPDSEAVVVEVESALLFASSHGDGGAKIAAGQLAGLLAIPDKERGSVKSTLTRILRVYGSTSARAVGADPNFDPHRFVRSSDTLYITAPADKQREYAPIIAGILDAIRFATYARHEAEQKGIEAKRPHVTFVLDEANVTAQIPLPDVVGESGGQSLHVIVAVQDLSRAQTRWGDAARGFLSLFGTKILLSGVVEESTLTALSNASGEYDRVMTSVGTSTTFLGKNERRVITQNPSYSVTREKVLHQGDIASLPPGTALLFEGANWYLINISNYYNDRLWLKVIADFERRASDRTSIDPTTYPTGVPDDTAHHFEKDEK